MIVVFGDLGWTAFDCGRYPTHAIALAQIAIYKERYPEAAFMVANKRGA